MKIANTCGSPQTIWLVMPVTTWPCSSMKYAAPRPIAVTAAPSAASAQKASGLRRRGSAALIALQPLVADRRAEPEIGANFGRRDGRDAARDLAVRIVEVAEHDRLVAARSAGFHARGLSVAVDPVDAQRARFHATLAPRHVGLL